jgi:hypothetical protein
MGIGDVIGAAGAILSGGATGLIGVVAQRAFDAWNKAQDLKRERQQQEFELEKRDKDAAIMAQEWAARTRVAEVEAAGREAVADAQAFSASFSAEPARYAEGARPEGKVGALGWFLEVVVDCVRGIIRPGLTLYLCWIATQMYVESKGTLEALKIVPDPASLVDVHKHIVFTLLYLFTTCVLWWFGTRNHAKQPQLR